MARMFSIVVNSLSLVWWVGFVVFGQEPLEDLWIPALISLGPLSALWYAFTSSRDGSLLGLYLQRKAMEQKLKIKEIEERL
jgi:hypothetical protein